MRTLLLRTRTVTLADQVMSSVSNVLAVFLVARAVSKTEFGHFAVGYAVLTFTLTMSRAFFGTRVSLAPDRETARRLTALLTGGLIIISPLVAAVVLAFSVATGGQHSFGLLLFVAIATPVILVQDIVRSGSAASNQPWAALVSDTIWCAIMAAPFILRVHLQARTAMALWTLAAASALVVALVSYRCRPRFREGFAELRRRDPMGESVAVGALVVNLSVLALLGVVTRTLGAASTGSLRGAATTMGPVNVGINFIGLGLTPALVRRSRSQDRRFCLTTAAAMVGFTAVWGAALLLLPNGAGRAAFGPSWPGIHHVLPFTVTEYILTSITTAAMLGLKVRNEARQLRWLRITAAMVTLLVGTAASFLFDDIRLVAAALVLSAGTAATLGWWSLLRSFVRAGSVAPTPAVELRVVA